MSDTKRRRDERTRENGEDEDGDGRGDAERGALKRIRSSESPRVMNVAGNKRMFGALMGHLDRAKKNLKEDSTIINKQVSRRQEVTQKNSVESQKAAKVHRALSIELKEKELTLRDKMLLKRYRTNLENETANWKQRETALQSYFVTTNTEPQIAWLPKLHSNATKALLEERKKNVRESISRRESEDEEKIRLKEESMAKAREAVLEEQRQKNIEWEAKQKEKGTEKETVENDSDSEAEGDSSRKNDREDHDATNSEEEVVEEEEEEEDILAAFDGKKKSVNPPDVLIDSNGDGEEDDKNDNDSKEIVVDKSSDANIPSASGQGDSKESADLERDEEGVKVIDEEVSGENVEDDEMYVNRLSKLTVKELKAMLKEMTGTVIRKQILKKDLIEMLRLSRRT